MFSDNPKRYIDRVLTVEEQVWQEMEEQERLALIRLTCKYCGLIRAALEQLSTTELSSSEDISSQ